MSDGVRNRQRGPFQADQIRSGDPYELSQGHPIFCAPTGRDGTGPNGLGFAVLDSDPAVINAGVDTGIKLADDTLRAPDVAVNFRAGAGTWAESAPLALEYAGRGQDEADLKVKIRELLGAGTRWVWVVRLVGPRRVEVHSPDAAVRVAGEDETLEAPGVLALPVPVRALFERDAAHEVTLRNLLAAKGYANLDALRDEGRDEGREEAEGASPTSTSRSLHAAEVGSTIPLPPPPPPRGGKATLPLPAPPPPPSPRGGLLPATRTNWWTGSASKNSCAT